MPKPKDYDTDMKPYWDYQRAKEYHKNLSMNWYQRNIKDCVMVYIKWSLMICWTIIIFQMTFIVVMNFQAYNHHKLNGRGTVWTIRLTQLIVLSFLWGEKMMPYSIETIYIVVITIGFALLLWTMLK